MPLPFQTPKDRNLREFPRRATIQIRVDILTTKDDAVADLAFALAADTVNAALVQHRVAARLANLAIDGMTLKQYDRIERKARRQREGRA